MINTLTIGIMYLAQWKGYQVRVHPKWWWGEE